MPDNPDDARRKARAWFDTAEGEAALLAIGRQLEARERERPANSTEARRKAQNDALKAHADLDAALGFTDLLRRRMLAAAKGEPPGTTTDAGDFAKLFRKHRTRAGRAALRHAGARFMLDSAPALTPDFARWLAGTARRANKGFEGVLAHEPTAGAEPAGGMAYDLRGKIIQMVGYTAGRKFGDGVIPHALWAQAAKAHNEEVPKLLAKGLKVKTVAPATIKDWCLRDGEGREQFEAARTKGRADRAARRTVRKRMLP